MYNRHPSQNKDIQGKHRVRITPAPRYGQPAAEVVTMVDLTRALPTLPTETLQQIAQLAGQIPGPGIRVSTESFQSIKEWLADYVN